MERLKVAVVGVGSIAQVVHLPVLQKIDDVDVVAICDVDEAKVVPIMEKFNIPKWYGQVDRLFKEEDLDAVHICTPNHYHYPMAYLALKNKVHVFVEKPIAIKASDGEKLRNMATQNNLEILVGMQNRFRDDVQVLKEFIEKEELGDIFYIKSGWLKQWSRKPLKGWQIQKDISGGGVLSDLGSQLIDLALFLTGMPKIKSVRLFDYSIYPDVSVEDSALAVIELQSGSSITIEVSWRMHLEKDMIYTHVFGNKGAAYLNPLRINKEMHGNLVNVTPFASDNTAARFTKAYEREIRHFYRVIRGQDQNQSPAEDGVRIARIIEALYKSARTGTEVLVDA